MQIKFAIPVVTILSGVSLLLQVIGFVTPGWTRLEQGLYTYTGGLWYVVKCTPGRCETHTITDLDSMVHSVRYLVAHNIVGLQTEATVALVLTLLASVTILFFRKFPQHHVTLIFVIVILVVCHVIAGGAALAACGTKARSTIELDNLYDFGVPYSVILTGLGAILNLIAAILLIIHATHVVHSLKTQAGNTPFYVRSQMHQPLTKKDSGSKKQTRSKRSKTKDDNNIASSVDNTAFDKAEADQYDSAPYVLKPPMDQSMTSSNPAEFKHQKGPRSMAYEVDPEYVQDKRSDIDSKPRKHRKPAKSRTYETSPVSDIDYSYEIKSKHEQYEPYDEPRQRSPRKKRQGHLQPTTSTPIENQDSTMPREDGSLHNTTPRKLRVKHPRLGRNSPGASPNKHMDIDENVNYDQEKVEIRPSSYYEQLELEAQHKAYHGRAEISPVESSV